MKQPKKEQPSAARPAGFPDVNDVRRLVRLLENSQIHEIEISEGDRKIRLAKPTPAAAAPLPYITSFPAPGVYPTPYPSPPPQAPGGEALPAAAPPIGRNVRQVKSPMVGTFYAASSPDAEPYVQVGDLVQKGQVLCIIEAMKLMNELESEFAGRITEIHVENVSPVEFDQLLFTIEAH